MLLCYLLTASVAGADSSSAAQVDIITEQPRSSQHTLQPGDSVDLSASSEQGGGGGGTSASDTPESPNDNEEEMLSRSSSGGANITPETADYTTPENATPEGGPLGEGGNLLSTNDRSFPPSDSSQTTTEGPDSAVTPSDVAELVSMTVRASEWDLMSLRTTAWTYSTLFLLNVKYRGQRSSLE